MSAVLFGVFGLVIVVCAMFALIRVQTWFGTLLTPSSAVIYVLSGSFVFYCLSVAIKAAFSQQVVLVEQPAFVFIPIGLALAAAMQVMGKRKTEPTS